MSFRVFWTPHSEQRLEAILSPIEDRVQLAAAARVIDRSLTAHPIEFGESRYDDVRIAFVRPLGVQYEVFKEDATVVVYDVWRIDKRMSK